MRPVNQIHDVGQLVREAVKAGWVVAADGKHTVFRRGWEIVVIASIVGNRETLEQHRRALGLDERKTSEAAP